MYTRYDENFCIFCDQPIKDRTWKAEDMGVVYKVAILLPYGFKEVGHRGEGGGWIAKYEDGLKEIAIKHYKNFDKELTDLNFSPGWSSPYHEWRNAKHFLDWFITLKLEPFDFNFMAYSLESKGIYVSEYLELLQGFWLDYFQYGYNSHHRVILLFQSEYHSNITCYQISPVTGDGSVAAKVCSIEIKQIELEGISFNML